MRKALIFLPTLAMNLGYQLEKEGRLLSKQEAYQ